MPPPPPVPVGTVLAGKYVVENVLGAGGMGIVVAARHNVLGQRVALKFLHGPALENPEYVKRFLREAKAVVQLESQFVARVTDVGTLDSGSPYIVMELLEGYDLEKRIRDYPEKGPLPIPEAVDRMIEALDALAEAHSRDIIHRDLKPANLFLAMRADGTLATKVLDFGISKVRGSQEATNLTRTSAMLGTPTYMAPEQVRSSASVDVRADIWAMGVVLFELFTGHVPFGGTAIGAVFAAILEAPAPKVQPWRPEVSPQLEAIVLRCLEKEPSRRFGDVGQLARALAPFGTSSTAGSVARATAVLARKNRTSGADVTGDAANTPPPLEPSTGNTVNFVERAPRVVTEDPSMQDAGDPEPASLLWPALGGIAGAAVIAGVVVLAFRGGATDARISLPEPPPSEAAAVSAAPPSLPLPPAQPPPTASSTVPLPPPPPSASGAPTSTSSRSSSRSGRQKTPTAAPPPSGAATPLPGDRQ